MLGRYAGAEQSESRVKVKILLACAGGCFVLGLSLELLNPMVKRLWTPSFTFFSAGWVILGLLVFYWIIEMKQSTKWTFPMTVVGTNCSSFIPSGRCCPAVCPTVSESLRGISGSSATWAPSR